MGQQIPASDSKQANLMDLLDQPPQNVENLLSIDTKPVDLFAMQENTTSSEDQRKL